MIWLGLGFVIGVILIIRVIFDKYNSWIEKIIVPICIAIMCFIISHLILSLSSCIMDEFIELEYKVVSDKKTVALKDNQNISGSFYITGGRVDEKLYYYYFIETESGIRQEKIDADKVYIKYTNDDPHIERYESFFKNDNLYLWGIPIDNYKYIIYCPKGTVKNEFEIDLE